MNETGNPMLTKTPDPARQAAVGSHKVWILLVFWLAYSLLAMAWYALNDPMWMNDICGTR